MGTLVVTGGELIATTLGIKTSNVTFITEI